MKIKTLVSLFTLVVFFVLVGNGYSQVPSISASVNKSSGYSPGGSGYITIKFKCANNIKISADPEVSVTLTAEGVTGTGLQTPSTSGDYLSPAQVKYNFSVSSNTSAGSRIKVKVTVKFSYCNSETGVCKIATKSTYVTVKVK